MTSIEDAARECARDLELFPLSSDVAPSVNESAALLALIAFARQQRKAALLEAAAFCGSLADASGKSARTATNDVMKYAMDERRVAYMRAQRNLRTLAAREGE